MKRVHYASGSFVTGDRIADALVHYASTLAKAHDADEVEVPTVGSGGEPEIVRLLLGPASQIMVEHVAGADELTDDAVAADLETRSAEAASARPRTTAADSSPPVGQSQSFLDPF